MIEDAGCINSHYSDIWPSTNVAKSLRFGLRSLFSILLLSGPSNSFAAACDNDDLRAEYFSDDIVTYSNVSPPAGSLDRFILLNGLGCFIAYLPEKHVWHTFPHRCIIEKDLPGEISSRSEPLLIETYLNKQLFHCLTIKGEVRCTRLFRTIQSPRNPLTGERVNPDIQDTYVTNICFKPDGSEMSARFFRIERQLP